MTDEKSNRDATDLARQAVRIALQAGADAAEVLLRENIDFSASVRLGNIERLLRARSRKLGLRVFAGRRSAVLATSDISMDGLRGVVEDTLAMARAASEDPAAGLPPEEAYARPAAEVPLHFPLGPEWTPESKIEHARRCEQAALGFDTRIRNSEGSGFSDAETHLAYANSLGAASSYSRTVATLHVTPLAEQGGEKQRDHWLTTDPDIAGLQSPEEVGAEAARRALRRLGARGVSTCTVPVLFDARAAATILQHVADAVSGTALLRKASFLMDRVGERVAAPAVTVVDDGLLPRGLGSRPFDAEGVPSQRTVVIRDGILESYLLDCYAARRLGLKTTANSNRDLAGGPSAGPSNLYLEPGDATPEEITRSLRKGLLVTELIGFGVNIVSGNYSQGAAGIWIEDGEPAFAVEEITIAGNLKDMLTSIEAVGNDLTKLGEIFSPTLLVGRMVVSGR